MLFVVTYAMLTHGWNPVLSYSNCWCLLNTWIQTKQFSIM